MQPGGVGAGEDACLGHDRDPASQSSPPHPSPERPTEDEQHHEHEDEHQQQLMASLPEDALIEILSRVPYRSLCRFKCVSKPWLALCSAKDIRRRSPQTMSGFFHFGMDGTKFRNLSGRGPPMVDPSLPFLRERYKYATVEQCCSSLVLCQCYNSCTPGQKFEFDYVVCNPATKRLVVLPPVVLPDGQVFKLDPSNIFLCFDTASPSRFVVFASLCGYCEEVAEVAIYSSETGRWNSLQSEWGDEIVLVGYPECVFLNGTLYLTTIYSSLVAVDTEGKVWREIKMPDSAPSSCDDTIASIGQSQGRLYAWLIDNDHDCQLYVWVLEDYASEKWTLKHTVNVLELFGRPRCNDTESYKMFAIHPDSNSIFLTDMEELTMSYDMDNQKVHVLSISKHFLYSLPYTPCFVE